ncbi:tRNA-uridine aminocarboxypropyltransferase [Bermanella sp. R86510]|uniref:tRNA-uridine aminocarboxypropyltransferase n=1 Tax=unclassified Bermanella TaxID=2627862 RepID=UPI0037C8D77A
MAFQPASNGYSAKGGKIIRCTRCLMAASYCLCGEAQTQSLSGEKQVAICLLMHKNEANKPTNTGRLIEDVLPHNTFRYYWHRTEPSPQFLELINNPRYQPYIIFPGDRGGYDDRVVEQADFSTGKVPLFIILDGSWRQAGRMFRLSGYLQSLPVLPLKSVRHSAYQLRKAPDEYHLCTAEVAIELLKQHEQAPAADALEQYFQQFNLNYARSRREPTNKHSHA